MRVLRDAALRLRDVDEAQHLDRPAQRRLVVEPLVQGQGLGDLPADRQHRVQRRHRLLKDHRNVVAAHVAHLGLAKRQQVAAGEADHARYDAAGWRRHEAQHRQRRDALAAAGLADDRQGFARHDMERDAIDSTDNAVAGEEPGLEIGDFEQWPAGRGRRGGWGGGCCRYGFRNRRHRASHSRRDRRGSSMSRSPSPSRLIASTVKDSMMPGNSTM